MFSESGTCSSPCNIHPDCCSVAKDRGWFTEYTPFETTLGNIYGIGPDLQVSGIGTVVLRTQRSPNPTGDDAAGTLRLTNVLHAPTCFCNILGMPIGWEYPVLTGPQDAEGSSGEILDLAHRPLAYFDGNRPLFQIQLSEPPLNPPLGPHVLRSGGHYMINAYI